ncbi:MAG TPA: Hsp20/alpha crystallin family protein [Actinomycetota bacterium]|jgi:HSP20 family protein
MLMRTELMHTAPSDEFDRITEGLRSGYRMQQIPVDAYRRGNEFKAHFDLPGMDPDSIELTVEKDVLTVRATRTWIRAEGDQVQVTERAQGEFGRQLFLGEWLNRDDITATYETGVLTITLPVAEQAKPRKIEVMHEGSVAQATEAALAGAP